MNIKHVSLITMMILGLFMSSCEKDDGLNPDPNEKQGMLEVDITDAPVDDPAVKSVFVTIVDLQVDGQSLPTFSPSTLDLLTLQNGTTATIGADSIKTGTYSEIALVLDPDECYIEDADGNRHNLNPEDVKVNLAHDFNIEQDSAFQLLIDFDLRKTIQRNVEDSTDRYDFVAAADLASGLRVLDKSKAGQLTGQCTDVSSESDLIIAYLYKKGDYDPTVETEIDGETQLRFRNAVTSAEVQNNGQYIFPFLENGEYELHFASFEQNVDAAHVDFNGMLEVNASDIENVLNITIESSAKTEIDLSVTGLLPL